MEKCLECNANLCRGLCPNCHNENFVEQYLLEEDLPVPKRIFIKARENEQEVYLKKGKENGK